MNINVNKALMTLCDGLHSLFVCFGYLILMLIIDFIGLMLLLGCIYLVYKVYKFSVIIALALLIPLLMVIVIA